MPVSFTTDAESISTGPALATCGEDPRPARHLRVGPRHSLTDSRVIRDRARAVLWAGPDGSSVTAESRRSWQLPFLPLGRGGCRPRRLLNPVGKTR